jgi:DNA-binding transcriptional LysR family regulator
MILTPTGSAFVRRASSILGEMRRTREEARQLNGATSGKVVAGQSLAAHVALLPKALPQFRRRYPQVRLRVIEDWYPTLEAGLKDGSVDLNIGAEPDAPLPPDLIQEKQFDNTRAILARIASPEAALQSQWVVTPLVSLANSDLLAIVPVQ